MEQRKEFGQGILFTFTNYVYWISLTNIYFILANIVFLFFFMTLTPTFSNIILYFLALIPSGPAISGILYSMGKLIHEKELSPTKDFLYGYKTKVKSTLFLWSQILLIYFILLVDLQYLRQSASDTNQVLSIVIFILMIVGVMVCINALTINSHFNFRLRDIWKLSMYYCFNKVKCTLGNFFILFLVGVATVITTNFLILFVSSIVAYLILLNQQEMLEDVKKNFVKQG
ncbi:DUF624 domain-containing protein [Sutcliffiella halmapala]|uniref:DUF624 domain-containing protein n=1 Tax=Sutcliffiella halmapala TaxID=79882 RepID=UPI000995ACEE|nr:DUF624 domain-containing protein [Sutcliffiella halmapala]